MPWIIWNLTECTLSVIVLQLLDLLQFSLKLHLGVSSLQDFHCFLTYFFPWLALASPLPPANSVLWSLPDHGPCWSWGNPSLILPWSYQLYTNIVKDLSCHCLPTITWWRSTFHRYFNLETYRLHITAIVLPGLPAAHCHGLSSINQGCHPPLYWCLSDLLPCYWWSSNW